MFLEKKAKNKKLVLKYFFFSFFHFFYKYIDLTWLDLTWFVAPQGEERMASIQNTLIDTAVRHKSTLDLNSKIKPSRFLYASSAIYSYQFDNNHSAHVRLPILSRRCSTRVNERRTPAYSSWYSNNTSYLCQNFVSTGTLQPYSHTLSTGPDHQYSQRITPLSVWGGIPQGNLVDRFY